MLKQYFLLFSLAVSISFLILSIGPVTGWESKPEFRDCSKCHPVGPPIEIKPKITVSECLKCHSKHELAYARCLCHDIISYPERHPFPSADAHRFHEGVKDEKFPGHGTIRLHPLAGAECIKPCHAKVNCRNCHAEPEHGAGKPCIECHGDLPVLVGTHFTTMPDGRHLRLTCSTCHSSQDLSKYCLVGYPNMTDDKTKLCYQCHSKQYKAWKEGKHYDGTVACTNPTNPACHDPHSPYLAPPAPITAPVVFVPAEIIIAILAVSPAVFIVSLLIYLFVKKKRRRLEIEEIPI